MLHELDLLDLDPAAAEISAVIYGHSHRPLSETKNAILFLNPGSAGPRLFSLPIAVAKIHVTNLGRNSEIIEISLKSFCRTPSIANFCVKKV